MTSFPFSRLPVFLLILLLSPRLSQTLSPSPCFSPVHFLQCLKLLCLVRQQLEEIRLKQEQQENSGSKRRKENRDQNQGESAGEKSRSRAGLRGLSTHLAYRNRPREKKVSGVW